MPDTYTGSCLCGQARFNIEGRFENFYLCHCGYCRKDTGSAHAANLFSSTARLTWLAGQDNVTVFQLPGTRHARAFCSICGSALPCHETDSPLLVVPAGSLDSPIPIRPDAHIFVGSRAHWDDTLEALPSFSSLPT